MQHVALRLMDAEQQLVNDSSRSLTLDAHAMPPQRYFLL
jgi:hypothetical protein